MCDQINEEKSFKIIKNLSNPKGFQKEMSQHITLHYITLQVLTTVALENVNIF